MREQCTECEIETEKDCWTKLIRPNEIAASEKCGRNYNHRRNVKSVERYLKIILIPAWISLNIPKEFCD